MENRINDVFCGTKKRTYLATNVIKLSKNPANGPSLRN